MENLFELFLCNTLIRMLTSLYCIRMFASDILKNRYLLRSYTLETYAYGRKFLRRRSQQFISYFAQVSKQPPRATISLFTKLCFCLSLQKGLCKILRKNQMYNIKSV